MRIVSFTWRAAPLMFLCLLAATCPTAPAQPPAAAQPNPVVLELFTSEGCSSCPPIDRWVERLDSAQPLRGAELIVLSEHVNYWDHQGWKDPYSSPALTERQENYVTELGLSGVYTPQLVLDGETEVHPGDPHQVGDVFRRAAATQRLAVNLEDVRVGDGAVTGRVVVPGGESEHGNVLVAVALDRTETAVLGGENDGKSLTNVAVVRAMVKVGKMQKGLSFDQTFRVPLPAAEKGTLRVIALVQERDLRIVGAGMTKVDAGR